MRRIKFFFLFAILIAAYACGYYTYPVPLKASLELLRTLFLLVLLCGVTAGLGRAMLRRFGVFTASVRQEFSFSFGLGLAGMSLLAQVFGLLGILRTEVVYLALAFLVIGVWEHLEHFWSLSRRRLRARGGAEGAVSGADASALLMLGLSLAPVLALALAPVTFYDSLVYHLALPQEWLKTGKALPQAFNLFSWLPGAGEHLWTVCLLLDFSSTRLATLFNFACGPALGLALWDAATQIFGNPARTGSSPARPFWAAAIFLTQPVAALAFGVLIPDGLMALHSFLALYAFMISLRERNFSQQASWLLVAALLAGAAMADKPVALVPALILALLVLWRVWQEPPLRRIGPAAGGLLLALLPLLPWLGRNLALKGNPFYPIGVTFLGRQVFAPASPAYQAHIATFGVSSWPWFKQLLLPLALTFQAERFGGGGLLSPLLLGLIPALLLIPLNRTCRFILAYLAGCFALWVLTGQVLRFTLYALPAACLLAAALLASLKDLARSRTWAVILETVVALSLLTGACQTILIVVKDFDPLQAALGLETQGDYLRRRVHYYGAAEWAEKNIPGNPGLLILNDQRTAYWPGKTHSASLYEDSPFSLWLGSSASPEELNARVMKAGVEFVFINWEEERRVAAGPEPHFDYPGSAARESGAPRGEKERIFSGWVEDFLKPVDKSGGGVLYQVQRLAPPQVPMAPSEAQGEGRD